MSTVTARPWLLAGGTSNPHPYGGPLPWGPFVAVALLLVGIPLLLAGVAMAVAAARINKKATDHIPGPLMVLLGAGVISLAIWLF